MTEDRTVHALFTEQKEQTGQQGNNEPKRERSPRRKTLPRKNRSTQGLSCSIYQKVDINIISRGVILT